MNDQHQEKRHRNDDVNHVVISYAGERLNYTYLAAKTVFSTLTDTSSRHYTLSPKILVKDVFEAVDAQSSVYGVIALESSSYGTIHNVYDKLLASHGNIMIVGEIGMLEQYDMCTKKLITDEVEISTVIGHPHILECCSDYLDHLDRLRVNRGLASIQRVGSWDSAAGCAQVAHMNISDDSDGVTAAIGNKESAVFHGLHIVKQGIGNDQNAETRYIIIAKCASNTEHNMAPASPSIAHLRIDASYASRIIDPYGIHTRAISSSESTGRKASIALALRNIPGSIFKMASCFALRDIDIIKIESRPAATSTAAMLSSMSAPPASPTAKGKSSSSRAYTQKHWDLIFYVDYEPSNKEAVNAALMNNLKEYALWIRELGSYCSGLQRVEVKSTNWSEVLDIMSVR